MVHLHSVHDDDLAFTIDSYSRAITYEYDEPIILSQTDHNSEVFSFVLPRYIDGHDMMLCNLVQAHYINLSSESRTKKSNGLCEIKDLHINPDDEETLICTWTVSQNATKFVGSLSFVLRFACMVGTNVTYAWNTTVFSDITVAETINNSEYIAETYPDVLQAWYLELISAGNMGVNVVKEAELEAIESVNKIVEDAEKTCDTYVDEVETAKDNALAEITGAGSRQQEAFEEAVKTVERASTICDELEAKYNNGDFSALPIEKALGVNHGLRQTANLEGVNKVVTDSSVAFGRGSVAGGKGCWFDWINFASKKIRLTNNTDVTKRLAPIYSNYGLDEPPVGDTETVTFTIRWGCEGYYPEISSVAGEETITVKEGCTWGDYWKYRSDYNCIGVVDNNGDNPIGDAAPEGAVLWQVDVGEQGPFTHTLHPLQNGVLGSSSVLETDVIQPGIYTTVACDRTLYWGCIRPANGDPSNVENIFKIPYALADVFSIINGNHYINFGTITAIDGNIITYEGKAHDYNDFVNRAATTETANADDYSVYVPAKSDLGLVPIGTTAFAEGIGSRAAGSFSHAEGQYTVVGGGNGHAEGEETIAGYSAHAEGRFTKAPGMDSHAEGNNTNATAWAAHAEGNNTNALKPYSHAEGNLTTTTDYAAHAEGYGTTAGGFASHAEGENATVDTVARAAHAEGHDTKATGAYSHAEGDGSKASRESAHAEGIGTIASGKGSHAEGCSTSDNVTMASGDYSHAEGWGAQATQECAHAEGKGTKASGYMAHAEGVSTEATGNYSHAGGWGTKASGTAQTAIGKYNNENTNALLIVGNGKNNTDRSNAFEVISDAKQNVSMKLGKTEMSEANFAKLATVTASTTDISEGTAIDTLFYVVYEA